MCDNLVKDILTDKSTYLLLCAFGHNRSAFQSVDWHDVSGHYFHPSFYLIEGVLGSKILFNESCLERPKTCWGPLAAILDIAGGERVPPSPLGWYCVPYSLEQFY